MSLSDIRSVDVRPLVSAIAGNSVTPGGMKKVIDELLTRVVKLGGSDLHLTAGQAPCPRVHGSLVPFTDWPVLTAADTEQMTRAAAPACRPPRTRSGPAHRARRPQPGGWANVARRASRLLPAVSSAVTAKAIWSRQAPSMSRNRW